MNFKLATSITGLEPNRTVMGNDHQVRKYRYSKKDPLFKLLKVEWDEILPACINWLIKSMPHCCAAVIAAKGMTKKY